VADAARLIDAVVRNTNASNGVTGFFGLADGRDTFGRIGATTSDVSRGFVALFGISAAAHATLLFVPGGPAHAAGAPSDSAEVLIDVPATMAAPAKPLVAEGVAANALTKARVEARAPAEGATHSAPRETSGVVPAATGATRIAPADGVMPRFTIAIGASPDGDVAGAKGAPTTTSPVATTEPVSEALVDTKARLVFGRSPAYPETARERAAEGDVVLDLVVDAGGSVESARVVRGVDPSLDVAALQAARTFRFDPAKRAGRTVAVRMRWSVQFRLR
jgi:TonB family protein